MKEKEAPQTLDVKPFIREREAYLKRLKLAHKAGKHLQIKDLSWFI